MTDSNSSLNEVPALLDERRRYEGWLVALDGRRDSTPAHVFERVQADYRGRLERVAEKLASYRHAIEEERANVQSRLTLLEADERSCRDERAELELRVHVGELTGDEAERAFASVDEMIGQLVSEKDGLEARIAELQSLLDEEARPVHVATAAAPEPVSAAVETAPEIAAATASAPEDSAVSPEPAAEPTTPASHAEPEAAVVAAAPVPGSGGSDHPHDPGHKEVAAKSGESFDELAFLSSIVGKPGDGPLVERRSTEPLISTPAAREERSESLLAGVEHTRLATGEVPLAANVAGNTPIVLRPTAVTEQTKTLKCNECGAMNYPTEWYCERCGAELAAL